MRINKLRLSHFRNHTDTEVVFSSGINLITGQNGMGKTNLIDGIHYVCMSRSFVTASDMYVVEQGHTGFQIKAEVSGSTRKEFSVACTYNRGEGKKFSVNGSPLDRITELIGLIPVVVLSPDDKKLTNEGPAERRSFLDAMISQLYHSYLTDLVEYRKIVRQRNKLLSRAYTQPALIRQQLEPWDAQLAKSGAKIIERRQRVLARFSSFLEQSYEKISGIGLKPSFEYKTISRLKPEQEIDQIEAHYLELIQQNIDKEIERQLTLAGPHRDDLIFYLGDMELRKFGSQGQHRLFALALKLAELAYFSDVLEDLPVFLLDDVFGDLDPSKIQVLSEMLKSHRGQSFITAANQAPFEGLIPFDIEGNKRFYINSGPKVSNAP